MGCHKGKRDAKQKDWPPQILPGAGQSISQMLAQGSALVSAFTKPRVVETDDIAILMLGGPPFATQFGRNVVRGGRHTANRGSCRTLVSGQPDGVSK